MVKDIIKKVLNLFKFKNRETIYINKIPVRGIPYKENIEIGCKNLSEKLAREKIGECFEWPNMVVLNKAIEVFINCAKKVVVVGSGTATFEWYATQDSKNSNVVFVSSEFDRECVEWCKKNRRRKNIEYTSLSISELKKKYGKFDLAILVDVIEHVDDYGRFLSDFSSLADKAVITTPNKDRTLNASLAKSPEYYQHVREWNAGEFYWVLKVFYKKIDLYAMPNEYCEQFEEIGFMSTMTPLIAYCRKL
jgi:2-polyprenyl-3-methyl-5-hydroxy-6-metoxy-1,4-benzoquinol methylase